MNTKFLSAVLFATVVSVCQAQNNQSKDGADPNVVGRVDNQLFTISESQLGEDDDMTQNIISVGSNNNVYASEVGYLFSAMRFKYRAYQSRYSDVYFNGVQVNNAENGQFSYSTIGGMNEAARGKEDALPFENNVFGMTAVGGSSNYNFRASNFAAGNKVSLLGRNSNYTARAMYTYATGLNKNGWAFMGTVSYRWSNMETANVEGVFYNSLAYFLSLEKKWDSHSLSLSTWGNPTERAQQGASTDEAYWLANNNYYNPYWGYQDGKKRNSRVVNNYEPSALLTWDWYINEDTKLTTSAYGKYAMYQSTKLNYNGSYNPAPDYWKNFPSYNYNVWDTSDTDNRTDDCLAAWQNSYGFWTASKANRQIQWDQLYFANKQQNAAGEDAAYYIQAKHNNHLALNLSSTINVNLDSQNKVQGGFQLAYNKGMHYQTMEDLMGANVLHNINSYAVGTYTAGSDEVQYDLNNPNREVHNGDRFGYDYDLHVQRGSVWAGWVNGSLFLTGRIGAARMWRNGHMRNGLAANNSYGESKSASFLDGGIKGGYTLNFGKGHSLSLGAGYDIQAPKANTAFVAPEINNDFVQSLKCEHVASAEIAYNVNLPWLHANLTAYTTQVSHANEWQNFYFDDVNSFTYVSLNDIKKIYYGLELGAQFKVSSAFKVNLIGSISEAKYDNNAKATYMNSTKATMNNELCYTKGMRESGTPLTALSLGLDYNINGWYLSVNENWYDRIYMSFSPCMRYESTLTTMGAVNADGTYDVPEQYKGKGGFMTDFSIGKNIYLGKNRLNLNLQVNNALNNQRITSGGYEQSRSDYTVNSTTGALENNRTYKFSQNPKKYYAMGINFMFNINYRF